MRRSTKNYWDFVGVILLLYFLALTIIAANENQQLTAKMTPGVESTISIIWYVAIAIFGGLALWLIAWVIVSKTNKFSFRQVIQNKKDSLILLLGPIMGSIGACLLGVVLIGSLPGLRISHSSTTTIAQGDPMDGQSTETVYQAPIPELPPLLPTKNLVDMATGVATISDRQTVSGDFNANQLNQSCILALDHSAVTVDQGLLTKTGTPSNIEDALKYGLNAALLAAPGATVNMLGSTVETSAIGAGGVAVNGLNSSATVQSSNISTEGPNSPIFFAGFQAQMKVTGGNQTSQGDGSIIFVPRASSAIQADSVTCLTQGSLAPIVRASGLFSATALNGTATNSIAAQIEPGGTINMSDSKILAGAVQSDTGYHAMFVFDNQDKTQKKEPGHLTLNTTEWSIPSSSIALEDGYNFFVDQCSAEINLTNNSILNVPRCAKVQNGSMSLNLSSQVLGGLIEGDKDSSIEISLADASNFNGVINPDQSCENVKLHVDVTSTMFLTGDIYVNEFSNANPSNNNIQTNGFHIYVNGNAIV